MLFLIITLSLGEVAGISNGKYLQKLCPACNNYCVVVLIASEGASLGKITQYCPHCYRVYETESLLEEYEKFEPLECAKSSQDLIITLNETISSCNDLALMKQHELEILKQKLTAQDRHKILPAARHVLLISYFEAKRSYEKLKRMISNLEAFKKRHLRNITEDFKRREQ